MAGLTHSVNWFSRGRWLRSWVSNTECERWQYPISWVSSLFNKIHLSRNRFGIDGGGLYVDEYHPQPVGVYRFSKDISNRVKCPHVPGILEETTETWRYDGSGMHAFHPNDNGESYRFKNKTPFTLRTEWAVHYGSGRSGWPALQVYNASKQRVRTEGYENGPPWRVSENRAIWHIDVPPYGYVYTMNYNGLHTTSLRYVEVLDDGREIDRNQCPLWVKKTYNVDTGNWQHFTSFHPGPYYEPADGVSYGGSDYGHGGEPGSGRES